jgi:hypothetical protein
LFPRKTPIASGATLIGSANREPDKKKANFYAGYGDARKTRSKYFFSLYPIFFSTIASGATPIGSAGRAPDEIAVIRVTKHALEHIIDYLVKR